MNLLQFASTIASAVLGFITFYLSRKKNVHIFIIVGQIVFRWLMAPLICISLTRLFLYTHIINDTIARGLNGIVYIAAILGIMWSVMHVRRK